MSMCLQPVVNASGLEALLGEVIPHDGLSQESAQNAFCDVADGMTQITVTDRRVPPVVHVRVDLKQKVVEADDDEGANVGEDRSPTYAGQLTQRLQLVLLQFALELGFDGVGH